MMSTTREPAVTSRLSIHPFDYNLPEDRIAQRPVYPADHANLMVIDREGATITCRKFYDLPEILQPGDLLVLNDTRVIPARLFGALSTGAEIELFLLQREGLDSWRCLGRPLKKLKVGSTIILPMGVLGEVIERVNAFEVVVRFRREGGDLDEGLKEIGSMPIPPYIRGGRGDEQDVIDYQTLFARHEGSVAAPTASLHFTPELIEKLRSMGVEFHYMTLHVGTASFRPLWNEEREEIDPQETRPGAEQFFFTDETVERILAQKRSGGRVIAVGTTIVRALETLGQDLTVRQGATELFIVPGHEFRLVDAVITNFHQPRTTHLLLVQALLGQPLLERSYRTALEQEFRFLSYGDAMCIL